jgi:uncharacterized protein YdcH (DUF465 family)
MEKRDLELIEKYSPVDEELRRYIEEHHRYEEILGSLSKKSYLSPGDQLEEKRVKKLKLKGRDKIEEILSKYRTSTEQKSAQG